MQGIEYTGEHKHLSDTDTALRQLTAKKIRYYVTTII